MKSSEKYKFNLFPLMAFITVLLLSSCGGDSTSSSPGDNGKSGTSGINGRIVFSDGWDEPHIVNIVSIDFENGNAQNLDILGKGYGSCYSCFIVY